MVEVAHAGALGSALLAYAVLDVVEGSAIDALQSMHTYLSTRPTGFASLSQGIEWHTRSRTLRNPTSARISVPALLVEDGSGRASPTAARPWKWRTDLAATQPFWEGWFVGLSAKFLGAKGGKLLILAGTDRLDKELMIGQMQGKYQLLVLPEVGHFVHEDAPEKTAAAVCVPVWPSGRALMLSSWWSFIAGTTAALWCCRPRLATCTGRRRGSITLRYRRRERAGARSRFAQNPCIEFATWYKNKNKSMDARLGYQSAIVETLPREYQSVITPQAIKT